jgi:hypothetical protein
MARAFPCWRLGGGDATGVEVGPRYGARRKRGWGGGATGAPGSKRARAPRRVGAGRRGGKNRRVRARRRGCPAPARASRGAGAGGGAGHTQGCARGRGVFTWGCVRRLCGEQNRRRARVPRPRPRPARCAPPFQGCRPGPRAPVGAADWKVAEAGRRGRGRVGRPGAGGVGAHGGGGRSAMEERRARSKGGAVPQGVRRGPPRRRGGGARPACRVTMQRGGPWVGQAWVLQ